jgi:hypothetical protein
MAVDGGETSRRPGRATSCTSHLSRIRHLLKQADGLGDGTAARLERRHAGRVLAIDPDLVDLHRFGRLGSFAVPGGQSRAKRARY